MAKTHPKRRTRVQLDTRLREYAGVLSSGAKKIRRQTGNWPIYAAATGSALAIATNASANLITSGIVSGFFPNSASVKPGIGGTSSIKGLLMGSGREVNIFAAAGATSAILALQPAGHINIFATGAGSGSAKNFGFQSTIKGHAQPQAEIVKGFFTGELHGKFQSGQPGFAGFSVTLGGTTGGTMHHANADYGWIELQFSELAGIPYDLQALAFGVDTNPNQLLKAGEIDGGYIPEPGTMGLSILAAGALGVMALRRRRRQA